MLEELLLTTVSDPDANAWANAVQGAGGFVTGAQRRRVATLIRSLKAGGVWPLLDRLWLFAAENPTQALMDLKARAVATLVSSPVFTVNRGYKGNHAASIDSGFNPSSGGFNYTQNSGAPFTWVETAESTPASLLCLFGNDESNYGHLQTGAVTFAYGINSGSAAGTTIPVASTGLIDISRNAASGAGALTASLNGVLDSSSTIASVAIPNHSFFILASNNAGAVYQPTDGRLSAWGIGGARSSAQKARLSAAMCTYMASVGVV